MNGANGAFTMKSFKRNEQLGDVGVDGKILRKM
jgi:hypothetical protein